MGLPTVDGDYMLNLTADLCRIPSPTGYTHRAVERALAEAEALGLEAVRTNKGSILIPLGGTGAGGRLLSAHLDTLGLMVKEIKPNGRLKLTMIGGYDWSTVEGEYCTIHTAKQGDITGTVVATLASFHTHGTALRDLKRDADGLEIRIDAPVNSADEVRALGISVGDFVSLDARTTLAGNGYIKSRHLDDKACVAINFGVAKALQTAGLTPAKPSWLYVSVWEEVGHGTSAGLPEGVEEVIAVDMAAVSQGQTSDEQATTVCVKDSTGPYDYALSRRLIDLAGANEIDCRVDIYNFYGSDVSQALRAGYDIRGALVGPGVDASHAYERLHVKSLEETARLLLAYLLEG
ncbi:MAG: M42 family metallopeptidase [Thermomicrobiales bacterium]|nr:M42 family metallopeptidase [Thermomicrobiales bacterium]